MGRYHNRREALTRIRELAKLYPDDPRVQELVRRASIANMKSKGDFLEISPKMVAYKKNEEALRERFRKLNQDEWKKKLAETAPITEVFPTPDPPRVNVEEYYGKYVVLDNVLNPNNQFIGMSGAGSLVVKKNIVPITTATVSTKGITMGANAALAAAEAMG